MLGQIKKNPLGLKHDNYLEKEFVALVVLQGFKQDYLPYKRIKYLLSKKKKLKKTGL